MTQRVRAFRLCLGSLWVVGQLIGSVAATTPAPATPGRDASIVEPELPPPAAPPRVRPVVDGLPLNFEVNRRQADSRVQFVARGGGYTVLVEPSGAEFWLQSPP